MRKTKKHKVYSIEEKNQIVKEYLDGGIRRNEILRKYDIACPAVLKRWVTHVKTYGTVVDRRGRNTPGMKPKGRKKKINLNSLSKAELISIIEVYEDIKKMIAYLRRQKRNIKSSLN